MSIFAPNDGARPTILTVPGLDGSGPTHWQSLWERTRGDTVRAELGMWNTPHRNSWVTRLDQAIRAARAPVILAAHSLGCQAVAWWVALSPQPFGWPVAGALMVAPADVDGADVHPALADFAPSPNVMLPFPSILVASRDDPWIGFDAARRLADLWGSHLVDVGEQGHINAASGLGVWVEGQELLEKLVAVSGPGARRPRSAGDARQALAASAEAVARR